MPKEKNPMELLAERDKIFYDYYTNVVPTRMPVNAAIVPLALAQYAGQDPFLRGTRAEAPVHIQQPNLPGLPLPGRGLPFGSSILPEKDLLHFSRPPFLLSGKAVPFFPAYTAYQTGCLKIAASENRSLGSGQKTVFLITGPFSP